MSNRENRRFARFVRGLMPKALEAIRKAEEGGAFGSGSDKLSSAAAFLARATDIPGPTPEWLETLIYKAVLTAIVELSRALWGKKRWFAKLMDAAGLDHEVPSGLVDGEEIEGVPDSRVGDGGTAPIRWLRRRKAAQPESETAPTAEAAEPSADGAEEE